MSSKTSTITDEQASNVPAGHASPGTITLETPLKRGDQTITSIALRKPASGELRGVALSDLLRLDVAALITVLPRISTPMLLPQELNQMDVVDLVALGGGVVGFFMTKAERAQLSPSPIE